MAPPLTRRRSDEDPENLDWWTNLPDLVARLEKALTEAARSIRQLRAGRDFNRKLIAASVVFNVGVMLLFGWQFDQRDAQRRRDIIQVRAEFYEQCLDINQNALTINAFIDEQIAAVRTNPVRTPAQKKQITRNFEELRQAVPKCVPPTRRLKP